MKITKTYVIFLLVTSVLTFHSSCKQVLDREHEAITFEQEQDGHSLNEALFNQEHYGDYVSHGYSDRKEGYDWVAVSVMKWKEHQVKITVRSRADKKKPTCTLDAIAFMHDENTLLVHDNNMSIVFRFTGDSLSIQADPEAHEDRLYLYCSGGASLAGTFLKTTQALDSQQIDMTAYSTTLTWKDMMFIVQVKDRRLTIQPSGLEIANQEVSHEIDGIVSQVEIGDLNQDNYPEVLAYITSVGSGSYGTIIGYSVNDGKSMSQIYLPDLSGNKEISQGYLGHDEFAIVEDTFVQRFPIYNPEDSNAAPTGGTRQIQYQLIDGEASRRFEVDKVIEY